MSEEIEYPSKERERAKVNVKVSAEVNTYLHDLYNQIQYEFCEQYEDEIKDLQQKIEQLEKENKELNRFCELYVQSLYNADLTKAEKRVEQLENIRKEVIEELSYMSTDAYVENYDIREKHYNLLMNILNKGENNGK